MIEKIIRSVQSIPAFPMTVHKVAELVSQEDYAVTDLVNLIKFDQAITANILKMSNAAYFGSRHKIKTIQEAVLYLGQQNLLRAVQAAGVSRFYRKVSGGYVSRARDLWKHAIAVATMSQILSQKIFRCDDSVLYTAALLHDIGKVFLGEYVQESFVRIGNLVANGGYSFLDAEKEVLGIDHAVLGGMIADHWHFPTEIRDAIAYHHRPDLLDRDGDYVSWLVYLSDQACLMIGVDGGIDGLAYKGLEESLKRYHLRLQDLEEGMIMLFESLKGAEDVINIV
ncbi:MAG TPA: HDOD domain-containing protein [Syntrophales bacterium]|nr:HDOD domain-containing protein [Syntrophales bacterium]HPX55184.1 HDOD domain-containing protein [Syntrophales bacterium]